MSTRVLPDPAGARMASGWAGFGDGSPLRAVEIGDECVGFHRRSRYRSPVTGPGPRQNRGPKVVQSPAASITRSDATNVRTTLRRHPNRRAPTIGAGMYQAGRSPSVVDADHAVEGQRVVETRIGIGGHRLGGELGVGDVGPTGNRSGCRRGRHRGLPSGRVTERSPTVGHATGTTVASRRGRRGRPCREWQTVGFGACRRTPGSSSTRARTSSST